MKSVCSKSVLIISLPPTLDIHTHVSIHLISLSPSKSLLKDGPLQESLSDFSHLASLTHAHLIGSFVVGFMTLSSSSLIFLLVSPAELYSSMGLKDCDPVLRIVVPSVVHGAERVRGNTLIMN